MTTAPSAVPTQAPSLAPSPAPSQAPSSVPTLAPTLAPSSVSNLAAGLAASLCRRFEGLCLSPYLCPAGVPTIGYGATFYEDGVNVKMLDPAITKERADKLLLWHINTVFMPAVRALCPGELAPGQLAALVDFAFNAGAGKLKTSTLRKRVNAGDWAAVPVELRKWVRGGGRVLRGLVLRREAEIELLKN